MDIYSVMTVQPQSAGSLVSTAEAAACSIGGEGQPADPKPDSCESGPHRAANHPLCQRRADRVKRSRRGGEPDAHVTRPARERASSSADGSRRPERRITRRPPRGVAEGTAARHPRLAARAAVSPYLVSQGRARPTSTLDFNAQPARTSTRRSADPFLLRGNGAGERTVPADARSAFQQPASGTEISFAPLPAAIGQTLSPALRRYDVVHAWDPVTPIGQE